MKPTLTEIRMPKNGLYFKTQLTRKVSREFLHTVKGDRRYRDLLFKRQVSLSTRTHSVHSQRTMKVLKKET